MSIAFAGLGKTTLAHVVARHCGYRALEINASDDRTATTLVARIYDAVQMQSVLGSGRPNCVIIDEIDGAAGAHLVLLDRQSSRLDLYLLCQGIDAHLDSVVVLCCRAFQYSRCQD